MTNSPPCEAGTGVGPQAWVLVAKGKMAKRQVDPGSIASFPSQLRVCPKFVGICSADLREFQGKRSGRRLFGHELVGQIAGKRDCPGYEIGDWVTLNPNIDVFRTSGFAQLICSGSKSPEQLARAWPRLDPMTVSPNMVFIEPLAVAIHCATLIPPHTSRSGRVLVIGAGFFGTLIALACHHFGLHTTITNRSAGRLRFLEERGFGQQLEIRPFDAVQSHYEVVVLATASLDQAALDTAFHCSAEQATIVIFSGTKPGLTCSKTGAEIDTVRTQELLSDVKAVGKSLKLQGSYGATSSDFSSAEAMLCDEEFAAKLQKIVVGTVPFDQLGEFFETVDRQGTLGKMLLDLKHDLRAKSGEHHA